MEALHIANMEKDYQNEKDKILINNINYFTNNFKQ